MPLTPTPQSRIRFAPMKMQRCDGEVNIADGWRKASRGVRDGGVQRARAVGNHRARGLRDQAVLRSEEAPTLMALGGFEQLTLNP